MKEGMFGMITLKKKRNGPDILLAEDGRRVQFDDRKIYKALLSDRRNDFSLQ